MPQTGPWTGDPVWIVDILRAEGVNPLEYPGWRNRGHGDFKDIRGVMVHHTGSDSASAASIAEGRPDLVGPLSQLHIARNGAVTVVAVGVAWHAVPSNCPRFSPALSIPVLSPSLRQRAIDSRNGDSASVYRSAFLKVPPMLPKATTSPRRSGGSDSRQARTSRQ